MLLLDPPYRLEPVRVASLLESLVANALLEEGAIVVWEHGSDAVAQWPEGFSEEKLKRYGSTVVDIAVYEGGAGPT